MAAARNARATGVRVLDARSAVELVEPGDVVAVCGVTWSLVPEHLLEALEQRFLETGQPRGLTEHHLHVYGLGPGVGLERFAHEGMISRIVGGSFAPPYWFKDSAINRMIRDDAIEVFLLPAGVICGMWQAAGAGRPGVLSDIGLGTFIDPRQIGGMITERARRSGHRTSEVVTVAGRETLCYRTQPIDVSFIRATSADEDGNLALEDEPIHQAVVAQAMATKASGGRVIAQVKRVVERGTLDPRLVRIPGFMVDAVVRAPEQRMFEYAVAPDSEAFTGALRLPPPPVERLPSSAERLIAERALAEIQPGTVVNLGAGIPVNVITKIARETGLDRSFTISVEHGSLGGVNLGEFLCQAQWNPTAIMDSPMTLDFYAGGALDAAFLGMAQVDGSGNVNVSMVGDAIAGVGGFMDIAQGARTVVFVGTLTYGGLRIAVEDGRVRIVEEGRNRKFVSNVDLISFAGPLAVERGQIVRFVTERCVFELTADGLRLTEVAPGIDIERDIAPLVDCSFSVADEFAVLR
jgi:propionate CoA-transferase